MSGWINKDLKSVRLTDEHRREMRRANLKSTLVTMASVFIVLVFCAGVVVAVIGVDR